MTTPPLFPILRHFFRFSPLILLFILFYLCYIASPRRLWTPPSDPALNTTSSVAYRWSDSIYTISGHFSASNVSESVELFVLGYLTALRIGEKWNVSLSFDSNSTMAVNITVSTESSNPNMWEGPSQFTLHPSESFTAIYNSHVCGDNLGIILPYFYLQLHNHTASASGSYLARVIAEGYNYPDCGTGQAIVLNITQWLSEMSYSTSSLSSSSSSSSSTSCSTSSFTTTTLGTSTELTIGFALMLVLVCFVSLVIMKQH